MERRGSVRASTGRRVRRCDGSASGVVLRQWRQWEGEVTRGGDHRRRHCAMVAGAVRRGDGMRVRVRASAVDGTRRGQLRAGPDSGAPRAQERPGGHGVAGAVVRTRLAGGARPGRAAVGRGRGWAVERETREREKGGARPTGVERGEAVRPGGAREQRGRSGRARGVGGRRERERGERVGADRGRGRPRVAPGRA